MTISIPDTLTADNSGKYIMSIRLRSDGLSFSGYNPSESETFFYRNVEFDRTKPYVSSLKEFFFEHEFMTPQLALWKQQSRMLIPRQLYVVLHRKMMDVVCFAQGKLLFVNTFEYDKPDDILYYILYVWKQVGMDQERDQLHIYGGVSLRNSITTTLRNYIQYISPAEIPSDAYLLGAEVVQAPLDLIALSVCEL